MEYKYSYKFVRMAPRKVRLVTNLVKNLSLKEALKQLKFNKKRAANPVYELLKSAQASQKETNRDQQNLNIKTLTCDEGPTLKRRRYKSRGRAVSIKKRTSHIMLILTDKQSKKAQISTPNTTKGLKRKQKPV